PVSALGPAFTSFGINPNAYRTKATPHPHAKLATPPSVADFTSENPRSENGTMLNHLHSNERGRVRPRPPVIFTEPQRANYCGARPCQAHQSHLGSKRCALSPPMRGY